MDVMDIRRRLMGLMASGAEVIKGTFTTPDSGNSYTLNFGKTLNAYFFLVEMTSDSKTALINSGQTAVRTFAFIGVYPKRSINNSVASDCVMIQRYNPSNGNADGYAVSNVALSNSSIEFSVTSIGNANYMYRGYSYNYTIVSLESL